jgi:hypothetical protein
MASAIVGRTTCPECGFASAHVKQSEKCLYRYCPECGGQYHAKTERQRANLEAQTRKPTPTGSGPTPTPATVREPETVGEAVEPPTPTPPKRRGLFT